MRSRLAGLWALQMAGYLIPLITIPLLARRLGPDGWSAMAWAQSLGLAAGIFLEYGFNLSATRAVSRFREDPGNLRVVVGQTLGAQACVLSGLVIVFLMLTSIGTPVRTGMSGLAWFGLLWTVPQSVSLQWLFHGLDRVGALAMAMFAARVLSWGAIWLWVRGPEDAGWALACQSIPTMLVLAPLGWWVLRPVGWEWPTMGGIARVLRDGAALFWYRIGLVGFAAAVPAMLAGQHGPQELAWFSGAERLARAGTSLLDPVGALLYPRWARELAVPRRGEAMGKRVAAVAGMGLALSLALYWLADPLVRLLLGERFAPSTKMLSILAWLPCGHALASVLGTQGLLAMGADRLVLVSYLVTAGAGLAAQGWFAPDAVGTAWLCVGLLALQGIWFGSVFLWRYQRNAC